MHGAIAYREHIAKFSQVSDIVGCRAFARETDDGTFREEFKEQSASLFPSISGDINRKESLTSRADSLVSLFPFDERCKRHVNRPRVPERDAKEERSREYDLEICTVTNRAALGTRCSPAARRFTRGETRGIGVLRLIQAARSFTFSRITRRALPVRILFLADVLATSWRLLIVIFAKYIGMKSS